MAKFHEVTHVIFDMDGLLLDTERLYTAGAQNLCTKYGKTYTWEMKCKVMGRSAHDAAVVLVKELDIPLSVEEFMVEIDKEYEKVLGDGVLLPGVEKVVNHLIKHKIPIAIASGSNKKNYALKKTNHEEFFSKFLHVVLSTSDPEVKNGKPNPEIFTVCASRFNEKPPPEKVLVFEDAHNGVQAAVAANMQVVMIPDSRMDKKLTEDATLVLSSMEDFQPELFGLPPFVS